MFSSIPYQQSQILCIEHKRELLRSCESSITLKSCFFQSLVDTSGLRFTVIENSSRSYKKHLTVGMGEKENEKTRKNSIQPSQRKKKMSTKKRSGLSTNQRNYCSHAL